MVDLTVVIPLYNGRDNVEPLLKELIPALDLLNINWEILFVDDCSIDNVIELLIDLNSNDPRIRAIRLKENSGQQNAVYCGLENSSGSYVITMDDDLQHPVEVIPELIRRSLENDLVYAVDRSQGRSRILSLGTWLNSLFFRLCLSKPVDIEIGSYRIFSRDLIERIRGSKSKFIYVSAAIFTTVSDLKVESFNYNPPEIIDKVQTRINLKSRFRLFYRLFIHYGPLKFLFSGEGEPYEIERIL